MSQPGEIIESGDGLVLFRNIPSIRGNQLGLLTTALQGRLFEALGSRSKRKVILSIMPGSRAVLAYHRNRRQKGTTRFARLIHIAREPCGVGLTRAGPRARTAAVGEWYECYFPGEVGLELGMRR